MPIILVLLLSMFAAMAHAGAWPREKGSVYFSFGQSIDRTEDGTRERAQTIYAEYGLTEKLTLGAKGWRKTTGPQAELLLFARHPIELQNGGYSLAAELALGASRNDAGRIEAVLQPGLAWGKGFDSGWGQGWISAEGSLGLTLETGEARANLDLTAGLRPNERTQVKVQLRLDHEGSATLVPGYTRRLSGGFDVELGLSYRLSGPDRMGFIAGGVLEF